MTPLPLFISREKRAIAIGLLAFLALGFLLPLVGVLIASFGPSDWIARYLAQVKPYQYLLFIFVGAIAAWQSVRTPVKNAVVVGFVGGVILLSVVVVTTASPHLTVAAHIFRYLIVPVGWCALGGLSVSLLHRKQHAL